MSQIVPKADQKTLDIVIQYIAQLRQRGLSPKRVILFGSQARGNAKPYSDVDLLVVVQRVDHKTREIIIDEAFNTSIKENIDLIALPCALQEYESPLFQADHFFLNIKRDGVILV